MNEMGSMELSVIQVDKSDFWSRFLRVDEMFQGYERHWHRHFSKLYCFYSCSNRVPRFK